MPCIASQRAYARKIGARFVLINKPARVSDTALSAWLKVPVMLHALQSGYDWVAYIDADCEIRRDAPDFRAKLQDNQGDVFMATGSSGRINSGVMIARGSRNGVLFFERVLDSMTAKIPAEDRASLKYENGNVIYVNRVHGGVTILDSRWNNTHDPDLDDYVRHYTGKLRPLLKRAPLRELQYQFMKRVASRQLLKFRSQPEQRDTDFRSALQAIESVSRQAFPWLVDTH